MIIYRGETGATCAVDITPKDTVDHLKAQLAKITAVPAQDQILLCEGVKLDKNHILEEYGVPSKDKSVFLFDRRSVDTDSLSMEPTIAPVEVKIAPVPPLPQNQELDKSPLVWALMKYENQFLAHLNTMEGVKKAIDTRLEISKNSVNEQSVQMKGLQVAIANLNEHYSQIVQAYNNFTTYYDQLERKHEKLLNSFETDMQRLRDTYLHSALRTASSTTLIDFVPEARLRKWAEECSNEHNQLKSRVMELQKQVFLVKEGVELENRKQPEVDLSILQDQVRRAQEIASELNLRSQIFSNDYRTVKERLQQVNLSKSATSNRYSLTEGFDDIMKVHNYQLSLLRDHDDATKSTMTYCTSSKLRLSRAVHDRLRTISILQSKIRDLANKILLFHEALVRLKQAFHQLVYVQSMPKAYQAALEEVVRRRKFGKKINLFVAKMSEALTKLREDERQQRQSFLSSYGPYLPKELIPGLSDNVPHFELSVPPFDTTLPQIDSAESMEEDFAFIPFNSPPHSKIQELEKENERLMNELRAFRSSTSSTSVANNSFSSFPTDLFKMKTELAESQDSAQEYKKRIDSLENQLTQTYSQMTQAENLMNHFKEMYEQSQLQLSQVSIAHQNSDEKEEKLKQTLEAVHVLSEKLRQAEDLLKDLTEKEALYLGQKNAAEELVRNQEKTISDNRQTIEGLNRSLEEAYQTTSALRSTNEAQSAQLNELNNEIEKLRQKNAELEEENISLEQTIQGHITRRESLIKELSNLNETITTLQATITESQQKINSLSVELENAQSTHTTSIISADQEKQQVLEQLSNLHQLLSNNEKEKVDLSQQLAETNIKLSKAMDDLTKLQKVKEEAKEIYENTIKQLKENTSKADSETSKTLQELESVQEKVKKLEQELKNQTDALAQKTSAYQSLLEQLQTAEHNCNDLETKLKAMSSKYVALVQQLEPKNRQTNELSKLVEELRIKQHSLEEGLIKSQQRNNELVEEIKKLKDALKSISEVASAVDQKVEEDPLANLRNRLKAIIDNYQKADNEQKGTIKALQFTIEHTREDLEKKLSELESQNEVLRITLQEGPKPTIATTKFKDGDWVLFLPNKGGLYEAVNDGSPNYYLSQMIYNNFPNEMNEKKHILGQIVEITPQKVVPD